MDVLGIDSGKSACSLAGLDAVDVMVVTAVPSDLAPTSLADAGWSGYSVAPHGAVDFLPAVDRMMAECEALSRPALGCAFPSRRA